jgi:Putative Actinobacterial Holin-X, holin superfamily III
MLAPANSLLRAGIGLKLSQIKLATRSYLRDRTRQATGTMASYAIAAGLFAAAAIFLIAACFVGTVALYRWIAIHYGQFWGFGAIGVLLVAVAAICAGLAAARLKQPPPHFPTLTSRLRVAIKSNPLQPDQIDAARDTAASVLLAPSAPPSGTRARRSQAARNNRNIQAGLIVMATLLGWAATRRRALARQTGV